MNLLLHLFALIIVQESVIKGQIECNVDSYQSFHYSNVILNYTGNNKLFHIVYEKGKVKKKMMEPHFWSYHQKVSLEHLGQTLLQKDFREECPILSEFLQVVSKSAMNMFILLAVSGLL